MFSTLSNVKVLYHGSTSPKIPIPHFSDLLNGNNASLQVMVLLWRLNEVIHVKHYIAFVVCSNMYQIFLAPTKCQAFQEQTGQSLYSQEAFPNSSNQIKMCVLAISFQHLPEALVTKIKQEKKKKASRLEKRNFLSVDNTIRYKNPI